RMKEGRFTSATSAPEHGRHWRLLVAAPGTYIGGTNPVTVGLRMLNRKQFPEMLRALRQSLAKLDQTRSLEPSGESGQATRAVSISPEAELEFHVINERLQSWHLRK